MFNPSTPIPGLGLLQRPQKEQEHQGPSKTEQPPATTPSSSTNVSGYLESGNRNITPMAQQLSATTIGTEPSASTDDRGKSEQPSNVSPIVAKPQFQGPNPQTPQYQEDTEMSQTIGTAPPPLTDDNSKSDKQPSTVPVTAESQSKGPSPQTPQYQEDTEMSQTIGTAPSISKDDESKPGLPSTVSTVVTESQTQGPNLQTPHYQEDTEMSQNPENEHPEWEEDSSPYESSSSSDSDSDSDDDDDEEDDLPLLDPAEAARILMAEDNDSEDEGGGKGSKRVLTTHEVPEEIVPIPDITVTPDMRVDYLGQIETIVDNVILIEGSTSGEYQVLESGSALCLADNRVIGVVADTLGRVDNPRYTVRFSTPSIVAELGLKTSTPIFYIPQHSTFVFTQPLKQMKGSDASNLHDEEVTENEVEFSDDEQEKEFKRKQKLGKKARGAGAFRGRGGFNNGGDLGRGGNTPRPGPSQPQAPAVPPSYSHPGSYAMWSVDSLDY